VSEENQEKNLTISSASAEIEPVSSRQQVSSVTTSASLHGNAVYISGWLSKLNHFYE
jgi:hypothetical protein